jgi:hypothetical protein
MRQVALPYQTPSADCWERGPWRRLDGGAEQELLNRIDDWDYSVPLSLTSEVTVDVTRLRAESLLSSDDALALIAVWEASSTGIREIGFRQALPGDGDRTFELLVHLDGSLIGGVLTIERQVVLSSAGANPDPLAPRSAGSVILREERGEVTSILLEGEAARFPTEVVDFAQLRIAEPEALWYLDMAGADLEQSSLSAIRLYVNGNHPAVQRALTQDDGIGELVRSVLQWDVARAMIHRALDNDEFVDDWDGFEEATLGATLQQLVQRIWPGEDAASLRARREAYPARFEYQLQARLGLFGKLS